MKKYNGLLNLICGVLLIVFGVVIFLLPINNVVIEIPIHDTYFIFGPHHFITPFLIYFFGIGITNIKQRKRLGYKLSFLHLLSAMILAYGFMHFFSMMFHASKRYYSFSTYDDSSILCLSISGLLFCIIPQVILIINLFQGNRE